MHASRRLAHLAISLARISNAKEPATVWRARPDASEMRSLHPVSGANPALQVTASGDPPHKHLMSGPVVFVLFLRLRLAALREATRLTVAHFTTPPAGFATAGLDELLEVLYARLYLAA